MSDTGDDYRAMRDHKARLRTTYGTPCSLCVQLLPKANPTILLTGQCCRIHNYCDPRPELTDDQWSNA